MDSMKLGDLRSLDIKWKLLRGAILVTTLFFSSGSVTGGDPQPTQNMVPDGYILVPKEKLQGLMGEVQEIIKDNILMQQQLEKAQNVIRNGMGCA